MIIDQVKIFDCIHAKDRKTIEKDINDWLLEKDNSILIVDLRMDEGTFYIWYRMQENNIDNGI